MTIDEPIQVVEYDPLWPALYEVERQAVAAKLGEAVRGIEHFGSTAVPGLAGKPVVDILVGLAAACLTPAQEAALRNLDYECLGEAGVPGRLYLRKRRRASFNLCVVEWHGPLWTDNLLVRDYLRAFPTEARLYGLLKTSIAAAGVKTLLPYSERKQVFVAELLGKARSWGKAGSLPSE